MPSYSCLHHAIVSLLSVICCSVIMTQLTAESQQASLPGCPSTCGNLTIQYPFGIGTECAREGFVLNCNYSSTPAKTYLNNHSLTEVLSISLTDGQARFRYYRDYNCYSKDGSPSTNGITTAGTGDSSPYTYSSLQNKFTVMGCDTYAYFMSSNFSTGCMTVCSQIENLVNGSCSGLGCCQTPIPKGVKLFSIQLNSFSNHSKVRDFNPCGFAFLVDKDWFSFNVTDITENSIYRSTTEKVPVVVDWVAGTESCAVARTDKSKYACRSENSQCYDSDSTSSATGYICKCSLGYEGNPYLVDGCQDINECERPNDYPCKGVCSNSPGSYKCECAEGTYGNATYGCSRGNQNSPRKVILVTVFLALFVTVFTICLYGLYEKRKRSKLAGKLYKQNGGPVLEAHLSTHRDIQNRFKIFTEKELELATNKFDNQRVVGSGGQGKVYEGTLSDGTSIAIKKSVQTNDTAGTDSFTKEIMILSSINHPNVVKLIGCCLEVPIPYLVYEFVPNKTLFEHIHRPGLSWEKRLGIAAGAADALAHLHTIGIYHQDVKSANIMLTMDYKAKISDFGLSKFIPTDAKAISTLVQGTIGYLDPEFIVSHKLTSKSDVFSFGVVLAELLTGKVPVSQEGSDRERSLALHFKLSMEEHCVFDILDKNIIEEATDVVRAQVMDVSKLAEQCLNMKGKERPDMRVVFQKLDGLWRSGYHQSVEEDNIGETQTLLENQSDNVREMQSLQAIKSMESLNGENEEGRMLADIPRSDYFAAFEIEDGR